MNDYIMHARSGWTKKNHKYISRTKKNGKWSYRYNNVKPSDGGERPFEWSWDTDLVTAIDHVFGTNINKKIREIEPKMWALNDKLTSSANKKYDEISDWFNSHKTIDDFRKR